MGSSVCREKWWAAGAVAVGAGLASVSRLWFAQRRMIADSIWAEDGLHALCAQRHGVLRCVIEPYAGFLHVLPRLLGGVVSAFPIEHWALASNVLAAACAGSIAATIWMVAIRGGVQRLAALALAVIAVAHPVLAVESVNNLSNLYVPLLYLGALSVALPTALEEIGPAAAGVSAALLTLTIPIAIVLVVPLFVYRMRGSISRGLFRGAGAGVLVAAAFQVAAMLTADVPREIALERARVVAWIRLAPSAVVSAVPSLSFSGARVFEDALPLGDIGQLTLNGMLILGAVACLRSRAMLFRAAGVMAGVGLAVSATTSLLLGPTTRYLAWLALPSSAALVLIAEAQKWLRTRIRCVVTGVVVILMWSASWPATSTRASVGYSWIAELNAARAVCTVSRSRDVPLMFAPGWPPPELELRRHFDNRVDCGELVWPTAR